MNLQNLSTLFGGKVASAIAPSMRELSFPTGCAISVEWFYCWNSYTDSGICGWFDCATEFDCDSVFMCDTYFSCDGWIYGSGFSCLAEFCDFSEQC